MSAGPFYSYGTACASWVIREKASGDVICETFNPKLVAALNAEKYEAVPIDKYLQSLNRG